MEEDGRRKTGIDDLSVMLLNQMSQSVPWIVIALQSCCRVNMTVNGHGRACQVIFLTLLPLDAGKEYEAAGSGL